MAGSACSDWAAASERCYAAVALLPAAVAGFGGYLVLGAVMDVAFTGAA